MSVIFINQDSVENQNINEKKIKEFLYENKHYNFSSETRNTNINESENLNEEKIEKIFGKIKEFGINEENELKKKIKNIENNEIINQKLQSYLEKAFKESIFEFKIIGLVIIDNEEQKKIYENEKNKCKNCETKILFHSTEIEYSSKILTSHFKLGKDNWYGIGIYFTEQFDYAKYYYKREDNFATIPKLGDSFNIVVSEVYYDKTKLKQIYNKNLEKVLTKIPNEKELKSKYRNYIVEKNGIHKIEVDGQNGLVINENKKVLYDNGYQKLPKERFVGREYCITYKEQILPLYGITFQRIDYCVIWRDSNFKNSFVWKEPLQKNKEIIHKITGYNLYTESSTKEALKLIWRKRFNKIILITNVGKNLEGKKFVNKVRKILEFNVMVLFFANDNRHLKWIKDYPNSLFCEDDYTIKKYVFNFNEEGINNIRENIREFYGIDLPKPENAFEYPLYEKYKDTYNYYAELDCHEYNDFDDLD